MNMTIVRLRLFELGARQQVLAGAENGRALLAKLIAHTPQVNEPAPCFLDFAGIDVATFSFLRESVFAYRDYILASELELYPVVCNAGPRVVEELSVYAQSEADAIWICRLDQRGSVTKAEVVGKLEPAQKQTLELLRHLGKGDAPGLSSKDNSIGVTAWNNRLAALASKGLLIEKRKGKAKVFMPVLEFSDGR